MKEYNDIFLLFRECFPQLTASYESFVKLLSPGECRIIKRMENDKTVGCAVFRDEHICLLCVSPDYRRRGIGSELLTECEKEIRAYGFKTAILGDDSWFFLGAVLSEKEAIRRSPDFFEKRGYTFDEVITEMSLKSDNFSKFVASGAVCRFIRPDEYEMLIAAVAKVDEEWCQYFNDYSGIFAAFIGNEIVSFCIVEDNCTTLITSDGTNIGSVGCVGTVPEFRKNGYGLHMVSEASDLLIKRGCSSIYIHYTDLEKWYGKLGFIPFIRFAKGTRIL